MNRLSLACMGFLVTAGTANAETTILRCVDPKAPQLVSQTYEWDREKNTGRAVEANVYIAFSEQPAAIYIDYLSGPQVGIRFRLDRGSMKLYVDGNNSGYPVAECAKVEQKI